MNRIHRIVLAGLVVALLGSPAMAARRCPIPRKRCPIPPRRVVVRVPVTATIQESAPEKAESPKGKTGESAPGRKSAGGPLQDAASPPVSSCPDGVCYPAGQWRPFGGLFRRR